MADIRLRIEVNPNAETETLGTITNKVDSIGTNSNLSNVSFKASSSGVYTNTDNPKESGREMLSWANNGVLKFNSDGLLSTDGVTAGELASETDPDMFVWGAVSSSKQYSVKLTFSNATSLKDIVVYGDKTANQFPTKAIVDGIKTIYSDDYQWAINMETESDTHTIEFVEWNRANYNACLTKIMVMLRYFDLDKGWIDSVESLTQSTSDPSSIQYGMLTNSGSVNLIDLNGELRELITDGIIVGAKTTAELLVNNKIIQKHLIQDDDYNTNTKTFNANMSSSELSKWAGNQYNGRRLGEATNLYALLYEVLVAYGYTNAQIEEITSNNIVYGQDNISGSVKSYLSGIEIPYPYFERNTYQTIIDYICQIGQLWVYERNDGLPQFASARPICLNENISNAIKIYKYGCISPLSDSILKKNKLNKINIEQTKIIENWESFEKSRQITLYTFDKYSTSPSNYTSSVSNIARNPNITVLGGNILNEYAPIQQWYYSVIKYTLKLPQKSLWKMKTTAIDRWTYWAKGQIERSLDINLSDEDNRDEFKIKYYDKTKTDNEVIADWVNFDDNGKVTTIKSGAPNSCLHIRINDDDTIDAYWILLARIDNIENNEVIGMYSIHSLEIRYLGYDEKYPENNEIYDFEILDNPLLQVGAKFNNIEIADLIKTNLLKDYKNGIATAQIDVFLTDMFNSNGEIIKNYKNGEILDVGDIIYLEDDKYADGSQRYWRITGRHFKYAGSPILNLELQEVIVV